MHQRSHVIDGTQGFTLIELLVALTLMALLSVILFGGLRFGMRAWETGGHHVEQTGRIETVQSLLRRQISQARFLPQAAEGAAPVAPFVGEPSSLVFIAPLPAHRGTGGSYLFRLAEREGDSRSELTLAWRRYRPELLAGDLQAFDEEAILLSDIAGIELSYYGAAGPEQPVQWWEAWQGIEGRPQLVRVRVQFPPGDTRRWPDLIIRILGSSN
jgi:general secretion pathway protein J